MIFLILFFRLNNFDLTPKCFPKVSKNVSCLGSRLLQAEQLATSILRSILKSFPRNKGKSWFTLAVLFKNLPERNILVRWTKNKIRQKIERKNTAMVLFFFPTNTVSSNALSLGEIPIIKRNQFNLKKTIVHKFKSTHFCSLIQLFWCIFYNHHRRFRPTMAFFLLVIKLLHSDRNRRLCQAIANTAILLLFQ